MEYNNFHIEEQNVLSKAVYLTPGSTSFPGAQNHYITAIMQWQFWWWFWFAGMLAIYNSVYSRFFYNRLPHLAPKIVTSYRSHGRWGDLIICLIPVGWCMNILSNSHFLLRALEWQTETAPFFLRVRGKQWYWVYKIDLNNFSSIEDIPKIIGRGKKVQFSRNTTDSIVVSKKITESNYTLRTKQDQLFIKINPNTNKSFFKDVPNVVRGRTGKIITYKKSFGKIIEQNLVDARAYPLEAIGDYDHHDLCSHEAFYRRARSQAKRAWSGAPTPPWSLIRGGNHGTCYHYHTRPIALPGSFSTIFKTIYKTNFKNTNLLWKLTYDCVLKDTITVCRKSRIGGSVAFLNPRHWQLHLYHMDKNPTGAIKLEKAVCMKNMPAITGYIKNRSIFTKLLKNEFSPIRFNTLSRLMSARVDVKRQLLPLITISMLYVREHGRNCILLPSKNTQSPNSHWIRRIGFIKKSIWSSNLLIKTLLKSTKVENLSWNYVYGVSQLVKKHLKNNLIKSQNASIYRHYIISLKKSVLNKIVYRFTNEYYIGVIEQREKKISTFFPKVTNPYLNIFYSISRLERRHLMHNDDMCANMVKDIYFRWLSGIHNYSTGLCKLLTHFKAHWYMYILQYSYIGLVEESMLEVIDQLNSNNISYLNKYCKTGPIPIKEVVMWATIQRQRSLNRWVRNTDYGQINLILKKAPLVDTKPLLIRYYNPQEVSVKLIEPATSITIKQKKIEKTVFDSRLDDKKYTSSTNKNTLVYRNEMGAIVKEPGYNYVNKNEFKNKTSNRSLKSNSRVLEKSYPYQKRLLWVNKVLLLPTHVAITIVTNSYDVIHSWFIPGLGLKLDCVPGRSTHHTIYIEYGGYYYGQCAEVCGRRHHHMPIKIRAIPFMIFSYWWRNQIRDDMLKRA